MHSFRSRDFQCPSIGLTRYSHRATKIDSESQLKKLRSFIGPVQLLWENPELKEAISSFGGFCELLGLNKVKDYLVSRHVHEIPEWGLYQLDGEGQAIQKDLDERVKVNPAIESYGDPANLSLELTITDH